MTSIDDVQDLSPRDQYTASAAQTAFDYTFPIFTQADLTIYVDDVLQVLTTDYTVSGAGQETGGTVTFVDPMTGGEVVTIYRDIAIARNTDIQQNGPWSSVAYNDEMDKVFLIMQELENKIGRAIRFPLTGAITNAQALLDPISTYAGKFLRITSAGILEAAEALDNTVSLTAEVIGALLNPQTAGEVTQGLTPIAYRYEAGHVLRYISSSGGYPNDNTTVLQKILDTGVPRVFIPASIQLGFTFLELADGQFIEGENTLDGTGLKLIDGIDFYDAGNTGSYGLSCKTAISVCGARNLLVDSNNTECDEYANDYEELWDGSDANQGRIKQSGFAFSPLARSSWVAPDLVILENIRAIGNVRNGVIAQLGSNRSIPGTLQGVNVTVENSDVDHALYADTSDRSHIVNFHAKGYFHGGVIAISGLQLTNFIYDNITENPNEDTSNGYDYQTQTIIHDRGDIYGSQIKNVIISGALNLLDGGSVNSRRIFNIAGNLGSVHGVRISDTSATDYDLRLLDITATNRGYSASDIKFDKAPESLVTLMFDEPSYTGADDTSSAAAFMTDSGASFVVDALIGGIIKNLTDGSSGTITDNDATTVTATLSGGTNNNWDSGDDYEIIDGHTLQGFSLSKTAIRYRTGAVSKPAIAAIDLNGHNVNGLTVSEFLLTTADLAEAGAGHIINDSCTGTVSRCSLENVYAPYCDNGTESVSLANSTASYLAFQMRNVSTRGAIPTGSSRALIHSLSNCSFGANFTPAPEQLSDTATNIADATASINTVNKWIGKLVWDTTNKRMLRAAGVNATSDWEVFDGSAQVTPS